MKTVEVRGASYRYPGRDEYAVRGLDFSVDEGEFVLVAGPSGSGKSTLCRLLNGLIPHYFGGELSGSVQIAGEDTDGKTVAELSRQVGLIFQEPEDQIVMTEAENEIAFGLENMSLSPEEIGERIKWAADRLGIQNLLTRKTDELSAGEKQKIILASVLAVRPRVLVLDEPSSQLDAASRAALFALLKSLSRDGVTVILVEHNVKEVRPYADRVYELGKASHPETISPIPAAKTGKVVLRVEDLSCGYGQRKVLERLNFTVLAGECLAVTGANGSGKTTLLKHFNSLMKPMSGSVTVCGLDTRKTATDALASKVAYLSQNPSDMLFCDTVEDELKFTLHHAGVEGDIGGMLKRFNLLQYRDSYPRDLSVGEKQRLALAAVLVADPALVVLDEPTRGIDEAARRALVSMIHEMLLEGRAVVVATHDRGLVEVVASEELELGGAT
jgi:energy-coupling factor transport system ATP-binding protein